ncbi:MAG: pyridoxine 5'-phosphate synthase, partial [candidate division Zixibacteria bacterium]|nr:pyridoxine 5'-phosphate synthase [candidate division Zixibacteria bacterium]
MSSLSISLDLVAVMRAARGLSEPDPAQAAVLAEIAGADGIAVQFRRDKKYIRERDLYILKGIVKTRLAVEMAPSEDVIAKVLEIKPWMVIFAADHADSNTPMSPIDFDSSSVDFGDTVNAFSGVGVNTSFYIDPTTDAVKGAARAGAAAVLLNSAGYTG